MLAGLNDMLLVADSFKQEGWESAAMVDWLGCQRRRSQRPASLYEILGSSDIKNSEKESTRYTLAIIFFFRHIFFKKALAVFIQYILYQTPLRQLFIFFIFY